VSTFLETAMGEEEGLHSSAVETGSLLYSAFLVWPEMCVDEQKMYSK
jgi:hypothetical protein